MRAEHLQTAIELLEKTVTSRTTSLGPKHPHTVGAQCELANVLCSERAIRSRFGRWQTISLKSITICREPFVRRGYQASTRSRGVAGGDAGRGGDTDAQGTCAAGRCFDRAQGRDAVHDEISVSADRSGFCSASSSAGFSRGSAGLVVCWGFPRSSCLS